MLLNAITQIMAHWNDVHCHKDSLQLS